MKLELPDLAELSPLIEEIALRVLAKMPAPTSASKLEVFTEKAAAELLGMKWYQLRDERRKGRIEYCRGPRNSPRYSRANLEKYLADRN